MDLLLLWAANAAATAGGDAGRDGRGQDATRDGCSCTAPPKFRSASLEPHAGPCLLRLLLLRRETSTPKQRLP
jgi:hypothetical protein